MPSPVRPSASAAILRSATLLLLAWLIAIRLGGPSDLWDQAQPRTVAYTVDMLEAGGAAWLLPRDADGLAATKPPLYNWIAAPAVALAGRDCELAHRLPSVLALLVTTALVVAVGERLRCAVGWAGAVVFLACAPTVKLGALARPDMLLVAALTAGWWAFTTLIVHSTVGRTTDPDPRAGSLAPPARPALAVWRALGWSSVVVAAWTKGPPALLLLLYLPVASLVIGGSLRHLRALGSPWALAALTAALAWPAAVAWLEPEHFAQRLMGREVLGRISGATVEGGGQGWGTLLRTAHLMPVYFMSRFLPWSFVTVAAIGGVMVVHRRCGAGGGATQGVVEGAALWVLLVVGFFSLSSGKRADYLAPALPMAAVLAAWWLVEVTDLRRKPGHLVAAAYATMILVWIGVWRFSPLDPGGQAAIDELVRLARAERSVLAALEPGTPLLAVRLPAEQVPTLVGLGRPLRSSAPEVAQALAEGNPLRLIYDPSTLPAALLDRIDALEREGRVRQCWQLEIPWRSAAGEPVRTARCVAVGGRDADRAEDAR